MWNKTSNNEHDWTSLNQTGCVASNLSLTALKPYFWATVISFINSKSHAKNDIDSLIPSRYTVYVGI